MEILKKIWLDKKESMLLLRPLSFLSPLGERGRVRGNLNIFSESYTIKNNRLGF